MDANSLITSLYQIGSIQFGEFILKSGQTSPLYINLRKIISYPTLLSKIAESMWKKVHALHFDLICGVPYTALPIATAISLNHQIPMVMRRKEKKDYGTKQSIEGVYIQNQHCLIIEDVITTGSSILETVQDLESVGLQVTDIIAVLDRKQGGLQNLNQKYRAQTLLNIDEVLLFLLQSNLLSTEKQTIVRQLLERGL